MRALLLVALVCATMLAGCGTPPPPPAENICSDPKYANDPICTSPDPGGKGSIRCVVTDAALHPLAGVEVEVRSAGKLVASATTTAQGTCVVHGLEPGTYFVTVNKVGYGTTQTSVEVVAGVAPGVTKILMANDASVRPYYEIYHFEGILECGVSAVYIASATCQEANDACEFGGPCNVTQDRFAESYRPTGNLTYAQSELVWVSTQSTGDHLSLDYMIPGSLGESFVSNISVSPVVVRANQKQLAANLQGTEPLTVRVFSGGVAGTNPGEYPGPACAGVCQVSGAGATVSQTFDVYTVLFYGFRPGPDYQFSRDGEPVLPQ